MKKKQTRKNKVLANLYTDAGTLDFWSSPGEYAKSMDNKKLLGAGLSAATGLLDIGTTAIGNLKTDTYNAAQFNAGSLDSLQAQAANYIPQAANTQSLASGAINSGLKGAQAGMAFGPWGAAIGAGIGALTGGITTAIGNNKEEAAAREAQELSLRNIASNARNIEQTNALNQQAQYFALGGNLFNDGGFTNGVNMFENGGTHEENPNGGILQGIGVNGLPNLVEEGEVKYKDYIFSNRLKANKTTLDLVGLPKKYVGKTYGDIAKNLQKESAERPNDPISQRGLADMMQRLKDAQETTRVKRAPKNMHSYASEQMMGQEQLGIMPQSPDMPQQFALGGNMFPLGGTPEIQRQPLSDINFGNLPGVDISMPNFQEQSMRANFNPLDYVKINNQGSSTWDASHLRYAPVLASGLLTFTDLAGWTNKTDTTIADTVSNQAPKATRLYDKMTYQPLDTRWLQNQANAQQAATRSAIIEQAGGNRGAAMAGLIGANYAGNLQAGLLARQELEYNQAQKQKVFEFNRATNQYNAEADKWEQTTRMQNIIQGAQLKEQAIQQAAAVRNANMNNFLGNITGVGQEAMNRNMITSNPALYYTIDSTGKLQYKLSDVAKYAKENNMTLAQAEEAIKNHAATNTNYKPN